MKQRSHRPTSAAGEIHIKPHKENHKERIVKALEQIRAGATHEEIAEKAGMRPDQVWKRCSELLAEMKIFDTGLTRKLKSGVKGIVWQAYDLPPVKPSEISFTPTVNIQQTLFK